MAVNESDIQDLIPQDYSDNPEGFESVEQGRGYGKSVKFGHSDHQSASSEEMNFDNISIKSDHEDKETEEEKRKSRVNERKGTVVRATQKFTRATTLVTDEILTKDSFKFERKLGKGAYGSVYLVRKKGALDGKLFAMKELQKAHILKFDKIQAVFRERDILEIICQHPGVVQLECTFQDNDNLYFLMEYAPNGTLSSLLKHFKQLPFETSRHFIAEIVLALEYLHSKGIVHRDLKPQNILIS